jgi:HAD superfamily hydrolase (TIGR01509 family)
MSKPLHYDAIIFDCDGTLVDSERVGNAVIVECVGELGLQLTLDLALKHFAGRKMADTMALIEEWLGKPLPTDFLPELRARMAVAFTKQLAPMDGVHDLLKTLNVPVCVASNGPQDKMQVSLRVTGLLDYFEGRIFSAYDCGSWKPAPGLFLHAAKSLGVRPAACAVVEDSPLGIQAAIAAGMTPFGYAPHGDGAPLALAGTKIFHHMSSFLPLILQE